MTKVIFVMSMSLDGFVTAAGSRPEEPMGDGGLKLVEWSMGSDQQNAEFLARSIAGLGAVVAGRRTYDTSVPWWGANGPTGSARVPVFVVTHTTPLESPENGVYSFVTGGLNTAIEQAKAAANGKDVSIMGGANVGRQAIKSGLVDEIAISLAPVLLGAGTRLFDDFERHIHLEPISVVDTPVVTHLRYRVVA